MGRAIRKSLAAAHVFVAIVMGVAALAAEPAWAQDAVLEIPPGDIRARIGDAGKTISLQETECTGIALTVDKPSLPFGDLGLVSWAFAPAGCKPPAVERPIVGFDAAPEEILELGIDFRDSRIRELGDFTPLYYRGKAIGGGEIRATFGALSGMAEIAVADRPRCTGMQVSASSGTVAVGGVIALSAPYVDRWGVAPGRDGAALTPEGCSVGGDAQPVIALDRPDRAQLQGSDIRGLAPGPVMAIVSLAGLTATARIEVVPPPPCNELTLDYDVRIAVGEVTGVAYTGGPYLTYRRKGAPKGQEEVCVKPEGVPYFESVNRHARVDRATGMVTGTSPGRARIGAVHGDLIGIAELQVLEAKAEDLCTVVRISYFSSLAFQGRHRPQVSYEPSGCNPPPGLATFSAEPIGPVTVSLDGTIFGSAPGKAKVTMRHGPLTAVSQDIEVAQLRPCTTVTGRFDPPEISVSRSSTLSLAYGPAPCAFPTEEARVSAVGMVVDPGSNRTWVVKVGRYWELTAENDNPAWDDKVFQIHVKHGPLSAVVPLPTGARELCKFGEVFVKPNEIRPGESARIDVRANFGWCIPPMHAVLVTGATSAVRVESQGNGFAAHAIHGGTVRIRIWSGEGATKVLKVIAPSCTSLNLDYHPRVLRRRAFALADVRYEPEGCTRPEGEAEFESSASTTIGVVRHGGHPAGTVQARDWNSASYGNARITMRHGDLTAQAVVGVQRD